MKYDYDKMDINDLFDLYDKVFDLAPYRIQLGDDNIEGHRDKIIACIERGYPQELSEVGPLMEEALPVTQGSVS